MATKIEYAIIVTGDFVPSTVTPERPMSTKGEKFWVCREPDGWVPATSSRLSWNPREVPDDLLTFATADEAHSFAKTWTGHPWWCVPIGHEIIRVRPKYKSVPDGYGVVDADE